jgi:2-polyprenyl-6-methoxyphenol hydroxylase-like FAD-dependent oxidoreductase
VLGAPFWGGIVERSQRVMGAKVGIPILVLGGGIGGVATALSMARRGRRVLVLEKAPDLTEIGAGLQLAPNAMRILDRLGVLEQIRGVAVFPQTLTLLDIVTAKRLKTVDLGPAFTTRYGHPYIVMHRSDLLTILVEACRDSGLVSFETSKEAVAIEDLRDCAQVSCRDGSVYRTEALIAADGLWSLARRTLFSDDPIQTPKYVAYRGTIPTSEITMYARPDDLLIWAGPEMHLVQYPVRGGKLYNQVAVFKSDRFRGDSDDWGTPEELDRHFSKACPYVIEAVKEVGRGRRWPLFDRNPIIRWAQNRVVLLGDAAHPMLQFLAQGACQAFEDALCIADCMDRHAPDIARAFVAFQNARFLRATRVQMTARFFEHFWHPKDAGADLRNAYLANHAPDYYADFDWLYGTKGDGQPRLDSNDPIFIDETWQPPI